MAAPARAPRVIVAGYDSIAHVFDLSPLGVLEPVATTAPLGANPSYMAIRGDRAYAVNETSQGQVAAFAFDAAKGAFHAINAVSAEGDDPCHISLSTSGRWAFVSNYSSRGLTVLPVGHDAGLGRAVAILEPGRNCHQAVVAERMLYVPFLGSDTVFAYEFNEEDGTLAPHSLTPRVTLAKGAGPRHLALDAGRAVAYILNELDMTLSATRYDPHTGALGATPFATYSTLPPEAPASTQGCSTAHVVVSSDGRFVYASNRCGESSSIVVFAVAVGAAGAAEALSAIAWTAAGEVHTPRDFALTADGAFLVCANQGWDSASVFHRDAATGLLRKASSAATGAKPCFVGIV